MPQPEIFLLASGTGFATTVNGNIVRITAGDGRFHAQVYAFTTDANSNYQIFDAAEQAMTWCVQTAATHQGGPNRYSKIQYWEIHNGYSITITPTDSGTFRPDRHPIWADSDYFPVMGITEEFPSTQEALEWVRDLVDREHHAETNYQNRLAHLRETIEAHQPPNSPQE